MLTKMDPERAKDLLILAQANVDSVWSEYSSMAARDFSIKKDEEENTK